MFEFDEAQRALVNESIYVGEAPLTVALPIDLFENSIDKTAQLVLERLDDKLNDLAREHGYMLFYRYGNEEAIDPKTLGEIITAADNAWNEFVSAPPAERDGQPVPFRTFLNWCLRDYFEESWNMWETVADARHKVINDDEIDGLADAFADAAVELWGGKYNEANQTMTDFLEEVVAEKLDKEDDSTPLDYLQREKVRLIARYKDADVEHEGSCCSSTDVWANDAFFALLYLFRISPHDYYKFIERCNLDAERLDSFHCLKDMVIEHDLDPVLPITSEHGGESLCTILDNASYGGAATYAVEVDLDDFLCRERGKDAPAYRCSGGLIGVHAFYNGSGYIADVPDGVVVELPADQEFEVDGESGYGIDSTYGLVGSVWRGNISQPVEVDISQAEIDDLVEGQMPRASTVVVIEKDQGKPNMFKRLFRKALAQLQDEGFEIIAEQLNGRLDEVRSMATAVTVIGDYARIETNYA